MMKKNKQHGFTLIEMIIYMFFLSILLLVLTEVFISTLNVQLESQASSSVNEDSRFSLSRLTYDLHRAENIVVPTNLGENTTTLQITIEGVDYIYRINSTDLVLTNNNGSHKLNSFDTTISNFSVRRLGNVNGKHNLQIKFTVSSKTLRQGGVEVKNLQTTLGLR